MSMLSGGGIGIPNTAAVRQFKAGINSSVLTAAAARDNSHVSGTITKLACSLIYMTIAGYTLQQMLSSAGG
jgi:hypothetical protein